MATTKDDAEQSAVKKLQTLTPLIAKFREQQAASYETLEEIMLVMGGGVTRAEQYKELETCFSGLWSARYGNVQYRFDYKIDRPQMLRLIKTMPIPVIKATIGRYLTNNDPFFVKCKHTFGIFIKTINQHAQAAPSAEFDLNGDDQAATGCHHSPRCTSDVQHTTLVNKERRSAF